MPTLVIHGMHRAGYISSKKIEEWQKAAPDELVLFCSICVFLMLYACLCERPKRKFINDWEYLNKLAKKFPEEKDNVNLGKTLAVVDLLLKSNPNLQLSDLENSEILKLPLKSILHEALKDKSSQLSKSVDDSISATIENNIAATEFGKSIAKHSDLLKKASKKIYQKTTSAEKQFSTLLSQLKSQLTAAQNQLASLITQLSSELSSAQRANEQIDSEVSKSSQNAAEIQNNLVSAKSDVEAIRNLLTEIEKLSQKATAGGILVADVAKTTDPIKTAELVENLIKEEEAKNELDHVSSSIQPPSP